MINIIILLYKFGQTWKTLTLQDSWNDLQFGMEGVLICARPCARDNIFAILFEKWNNAEITNYFIWQPKQFIKRSPQKYSTERNHKPRKNDHKNRSQTLNRRKIHCFLTIHNVSRKCISYKTIWTAGSIVFPSYKSIKWDNLAVK